MKCSVKCSVKCSEGPGTSWPVGAGLQPAQFGKDSSSSLRLPDLRPPSAVPLADLLKELLDGRGGGVERDGNRAIRLGREQAVGHFPRSDQQQTALRAV